MRSVRGVPGRRSRVDISIIFKCAARVKQRRETVCAVGNREIYSAGGGGGGGTGRRWRVRERRGMPRHGVAGWHIYRRPRHLQPGPRHPHRALFCPFVSPIRRQPSSPPVPRPVPRSRSSPRETLSSLSPLRAPPPNARLEPGHGDDILAAASFSPARRSIDRSVVGERGWRGKSTDVSSRRPFPSITIIRNF